MSLSVIITYYDQPLDILLAHVRACCAARLIPSEIIVVNDGSKKDCVGELGKYPWEIPLRVATIQEDIHWNQGGARNLGLLISSSQYLSMEDMDCFPLRNYYSEAVSRLQSMKRVQFFPNKGGSYSPGCCVVKRMAAVAVGGWNEDYSGNYGHDDLWFNYSIEKKFGPPFHDTATLIEMKGSGAATTGRARNVTVNKALFDKMEREKIGHTNKNMLRFHYTIDLIGPEVSSHPQEEMLRQWMRK